MKKLLTIALSLMLALLCIPALAEQSDTMPDEIRAIFENGKWASFTPLDYVQPDGGTTAFVAARGDREDRIMCFKQTDGNWKLSWANGNALPQDGEPLSLLDLSGTTYNGMALDTAFSIREAAAGSWESVYEQEGSIWRLRMICYHDTDDTILETFLIEEDIVRYEGYRKDGQVRIYGTVQTDLRYFSFEDFEFDPDSLRNRLTNPPTIPSGDLVAQRIKFTGGKKYTVYQGPGEGYGQAGNGKAHVSTNDWIQVFGEENGWIMIQYAISRDHMRIGWIDADALPASADVEHYSFEPTSAYTTSAVTLTDDPLYSGAAILTLPKGAWVEWLSTMGDWAYVESSTGDLVRGFVPVDALSATFTFYLENHPTADLNTYPLTGSLSIEPDGTLTLNARWMLADAPASLSVYDDISGALILTAQRQSDGSYAGSGVSHGYSWRVCPAEMEQLTVTLSR